MKIKTLIHIALIGDGICMLWILRNAIASGANAGGIMENVLPGVLFILLGFNFFLLWKRK